MPIHRESHLSPALPGLSAALLIGLVACGPPGGSETPPTASNDAPNPEAAFSLEEVVPGIFHARGTGSMSVGSHGAAIVNEDEVLLVDSHISPAAASAILAQVESVTGKPVRYVVNTHFHFDHAHGNQIYPPDVHVIGHEFTRERLMDGGSTGRSYQMFVGTLPDQIEQLEAELEATPEGEARDEVASRLAFLRQYWDEQQEVVPTGPNTTLSERMTLFRGDREIQLLFFGRGHTGGDVVVYLPEERVLVSGDLFVPGLPYMGDGYLEEWVETLEALKGLDFEWVLPGHGEPFMGKERLGWLQDYMRDLDSQARALHAQGLSFEEAAQQIDLTAHAEHYPQITGPGVGTVVVQRIWDLLEGRDGD
ncbi:MAG: MBL fold metallo-hydrolase [Gemmatimonadetes bacterium]|nr:MBL fold metallo-hydrolase [Gemmatimonadota bacterium]NNM34207.1 MBL fold metallo-hydrolase [Gemmatimonadota bacterium]